MVWFNKNGERVGRFYVGQRVEIIDELKYKGVKGFIAAIYSNDGFFDNDPIKFNKCVICPDANTPEDNEAGQQVYWNNPNGNNNYGDAPRISSDYLYEKNLKIINLKINDNGNLE